MVRKSTCLTIRSSRARFAVSALALRLSQRRARSAARLNSGVRSPMKVFLKSLLALAFLAASMSAAAGKGHLGFTVHYTLKRSAFDAKLDRVVVTKVKQNSPAMRAGLMPGDVIEFLNGSVVAGASARKLDKEMGAVQAGDTVKMTVLRSGKKVAISMVAGET